MDLTDIQAQVRSLNTLDLEHLDMYVYNCQRTTDQEAQKLAQKPIKHTTCCNLCSSSTEEYYPWKLVYGLKPKEEDQKEEDQKEEESQEEEEAEKQIYLDLCKKCANQKAISDFIQADLTWSTWASSWIFKPTEPEMVKHRHLFMFEEKRNPNIERD